MGERKEQKMKDKNWKIELIRKHYDEIVSMMKMANKTAILYPMCEYRVYIDSNGDIDYEEHTQGSHERYVFRDPDYCRIYIHTYSHPCYDVLWDYGWPDRDYLQGAVEQEYGNIDIDLSGAYNDDSLIDAVIEATGNGRASVEDWIDRCRNEAADFMLNNTDQYDYCEVLNEVISDIEKFG